MLLEVTPYLILNLTKQVNNFVPQCVFVKEVEDRVVLLQRSVFPLDKLAA